MSPCHDSLGLSSRTVGTLALNLMGQCLGEPIGTDFGHHLPLAATSLGHEISEMIFLC